MKTGGDEESDEDLFLCFGIYDMTMIWSFIWHLLKCVQSILKLLDLIDV